jgi:predicted dehydrogenase
MEKDVWIVGAGSMAEEYSKILRHMMIEPTIIGRSESSAKLLENKLNVPVFSGGIEMYLESHNPDKDTYIIIAVGTEVLLPTLLLFKDLEFSGILVEKPAALSINELIENKLKVSSVLGKTFVAYNRRFYPSVIKALELVEEDGGLESMHFEFTEWAHKIEPLTKANGVKENWFFANSTHVVDLAFYIAGQPFDWRCFVKEGNLGWHKYSNFSGAGITDRGVLFSYISNWQSAGRWGIELLTSKRRIYLKPLEKLSFQKKGSIEIENCIINESNNCKGFKPGLYAQLADFLFNRGDKLLGLEAHIENTRLIYSKMVNCECKK